MGIRTRIIRSKTHKNTYQNMKLLSLIAVGFVAAQELGLNCKYPDMETKAATYTASTAEPINMEELAAKIAKLNEDRRAAIPEAKILTCEEIKEVYGAPMVTKLGLEC